MGQAHAMGSHSPAVTVFFSHVPTVTSAFFFGFVGENWKIDVLALRWQLHVGYV
jgi:hypothetical protein